MTTPAPPLRLAFALALAAAAIAAAISRAGDADAQGAAAQPNVVMVMTDDQTLGMMSRETMPKTSKLVVRAGTNFEQAIATTPLCCPSRATFLTGQYAHNHGVLENDFGLLRDEASTLPVWLRAAGYRTIHVGKYMNRYKKSRGANTIAPGWDEWHTALERYSYYDYVLRINGRRKAYGDDPDDYLTRVLNEIAVKQVERAAGARPFYLQLDHYPPHIAPGDNRRCDGAAVPDPRDYERFEDVSLPETANFNEADVTDKPSFIQRLRPLKRKKIRDLERRYGCALASLRGVDRGVAELFGALERSGELEDTVVIFVSDNGFYYGEHRIPDAKQNPYEEALRIPLAIRVPPRFVGGADPPASVGELVGNIDVVPTILELAGAIPCTAEGACRTLDGRSLVPLLAGQPGAMPNDRAFAIELQRIALNAPILGGRACTYTGVRTPGHLYVHHTEALNGRTRACEPVDDVELYDLRADPLQLESRHGAAPGTPDAITEAALAERAAVLRDCAGIQGRDPLPPSGHWCE
jgi:N-acetylglucosamine-6-sulfatase